MINFELNAKNQIMLNPKLLPLEKKTLIELKEDFEKEFGNSGYILVPSSGSSKKFNESVKLIALRVSSILNSANRVNHYLKATENDHWGLVLPPFHVAGIGVSARAYLAYSQVFNIDWNLQNFNQQIELHNISFLSVVPTQIYDLVAYKLKCPSCIKKIFVGGGQLSNALRDSANLLGWPIVETYGMTETASMIAIREKDKSLFEVLDQVNVKSVNNFLNIHCDSLLTAIVQKISNETHINYYDENSWYCTEDQAELVNIDAQIYLKLLGRKTDYVKILGEGVSLLELRSQLDHIVMSHSTQPNQFEFLAIEDERAGAKLILVAEETVSEDVAKSVLNRYNGQCRAYERISHLVKVQEIPRTELGKLKSEVLKSIITDKLS